MSKTEDRPGKMPCPKRTAQPDAGAKYEVSVATLVAAILSKNEDIEDYHVFTNLQEAVPFDDVVAKVLFKGQDTPYAFAIQVKHIGKGETLKIEKYQKGYDKIHGAGGLKTIGEIAANNIHFCYFCIGNVKTNVDYSLHANNSNSESWRSALSFESCHRLSYAKPITGTDKNRKDFLDNFYLYLNQSDDKVQKEIKSLCKVSDATDISKYVDRFFEKDVLWKRGLCREVFDTELLRIRLCDYIVTPTDIIQLQDSQVATWNKLILKQNITIVENGINIEKSLYGCIAQMLNDLLSNAVDWNKCKTDVLDSTVIQEFKKLFARGEPVRVRHWINAPTTLKSLIVELWKMGEVPLILKVDEGLSALKDYTHLEKCYVLITDDLERRRDEISGYRLSVFTGISDIQNIEIRDELLKSIVISLQGRKPITLYTFFKKEKEEELMATLSCSHILHLMESRKAYLKRECLEGDYNAIFLIENPTSSDNIDDICKGGGNFAIRCRSNETTKYRKQIEQHSKLQNYTIFECASSPQSDNFILIEGNKSLLSNFFVDQYGESVYNLDSNPIPILGYNLRFSIQPNYIPRFLRIALISKSLFDSRTKGISFFSGDFTCLDDNVRKKLVKISDEKIQFDNENVFFDVRGKDIDTYWQEASKLKCPLLHIRVEGTDLQLCKCKHWKGLGDYISYTGRQISEANLLTEITDGITVLTGEPGIGKSSLLQSLFKNHGAEKYILFYNLVDYKAEKQNQLLPSNFSLDFILNKFKGTRYNEFLSAFSKKKESLLVLLDSFDEVLPNHKEKILSFIRNLAASNVTIIIASRLIANHVLMDQFETRIFKVDILEVNDRREYIKSCKLNEEDLTTFPVEFIEVPLYLNFLKTISESNVTLTRMSRLTLFQRIVDIKLDQFFERNFSVDYDTTDKEHFLQPVLELHEKLALVRILGVNVVEELLNWKYEGELLNKLKLGIVLAIDEESYPTFVHETFAEYLTAKWLAKNVGRDCTRGVYQEMLKNDKLYVLDIFCEHLKLHKAVIDRNLKQITIYAQERLHLEETDELGRTPLHVASACFKRSSFPYFFLLYSPIDILIHNMCEFNIELTVADDLMRWDWIQHLNRGNVINLMPCYDLSMSVIEIYVNGIIRKIHDGIVKLNMGDRLASQIRQTYGEAMEISRIKLIRDLFFLEDVTLNGVPQALLHSECQMLEAHTLNLQRIRGFSPLHIACIHGNVEVVRNLIELQHDVNITDDFGCTPLHYSIINPPEVCMDMIKLLLGNGSKVDIMNRREETAIIIAVRSGNIDVVQLLLHKGAFINSTEKDMQTLLFLALERGDRNMTAFLLEYQADPNGVNEDGESALEFLFNSVEYHPELVKLLHDNGAAVNYSNDTYNRPAFMKAIQERNLEGIRLLLEYGADIEGPWILGKTPLMFACESEREIEDLFIRRRRGANFNSLLIKSTTTKPTIFDVIKLLLERGASVNSTTKFVDETPLMLASVKSSVNVIELLLKNGADINTTTMDGKSPIMFASGTGRLDMVKLLLKNGDNVNRSTNNGKTPLMFAVENGQLDVIKLLLKEGANINSATTHDETPLTFAARRSNYDIVRLLLKEGANPNCSMFDNETLLMFAIRQNEADIVKLLLQKGANINSETTIGETPLISSLKCGNFTATKLLLEKCANVNGTTNFHETPLLLALEEDNLDVIKLLLAKGANVNSTTNFYESPLLFALKKNNIDVIKLLLEKGANVNSTTNFYESPLLLALEKDNLDVIKLLLEKGANVNSRTLFSKIPLLLALEKNNLDVIKLLLEKGANVNCVQGYFTPLTIAVRMGNLNVVKLLLENGANALRMYAFGSHKLDIDLLLAAGANINSRTFNDTPLRFAIRTDNTDQIRSLLERDGNARSTIHDEKLLIFAVDRNNLNVTKLLLDYGADINSITEYGEALLLHACLFGSLDMVKLLIERGANVNSETKTNETPLMLAVGRMNADIVKLMLERGANVNSKTRNDETPFMFAVKWMQIDVLELMLEKGANVNSTTTQGETPLMIAVERMQIDIVELMLEKGANVNSKTTDGESLLLYASKYASSVVVKLLLEKGADINDTTIERDKLLKFACTRCNLDILKLLLRKNVNVNIIITSSRREPLLIDVVQWGDLDVVNLLLEKGANVNSVTSCGKTSLMYAAERGNIEIIRLLIEKGANINSIKEFGDTPLSCALKCFSRHPNISEVVELLLKEGAKVNITTSFCAPLYAALAHDNPHIIELLLEKGAKITSFIYDHAMRNFLYNQIQK